MIETIFSIGERVRIDGDDSLAGTVTAIEITANGATFKVRRFHNGARFDEWYEAAHLTSLREPF